MQVCTSLQTVPHHSVLQAGCPFCRPADSVKALKAKRSYHLMKVQEAQLSPSDRAMRLVSSNLANYHATVCDRWYELEAMCYKQTDDGRVVYKTCITTTCCGEIF